MALPEIATPIYTLTVPSTKKRVKYRPFLVKEQKLLILALENDDQEQILDAITKTIQNCLHTKIKVEDMALFDIEYLFLQIRARSISEEIEMKVTCADDGETTVDVKFMVDDVKVNFPKGHTNTIKLNDELTVEMKYPDIDYFTKINFVGEEPDPYKKILPAYHEALDLYKNQKWQKAIEAFKASDALEDMFPGRKTNPSRIYIPRCEHYLSNPPGDDWDGVWTLTSK